MKRPRMKDDLPWEDPNKLKISELQQFLSAFRIQYDKTERRTKLFQRYVKLAQIESPGSVELWTKQDSLGTPLPAADQLVVPTLKIFLALHEVDYPAQASRGHLIKLYNSIPTATNPGPQRRSSVVSVLIPSHEQKKRRTNSHPISPAPQPSCEDPNTSEASKPSYAGKSLHDRARATALLPYSRQSPRSKGAQEYGQVLRSSKRILSRASRSSEGRILHPRSTSLPGTDDDSASRPAKGRCVPRKSESHRNSNISHDDPPDNEHQSVVVDQSCIPSSLTRETLTKKNKKTSRRSIVDESYIPSSSTRKTLTKKQNKTSSLSIVDESDIPSSSAPEKLTKKNKKTSKSSTVNESCSSAAHETLRKKNEKTLTLARRQSSSRQRSSQVPESSCEGEINQQSPRLLESQEDELASTTTAEWKPASITSRSTRFSENSGNELHDQEDELASTTTTEWKPASIISRSTRLSENSGNELQEDELASTTTTEWKPASIISRSTRFSENSGNELQDQEDELASTTTTELKSPSVTSRPTRSPKNSRYELEEEDELASTTTTELKSPSVTSRPTRFPKNSRYELEEEDELASTTTAELKTPSVTSRPTRFFKNSQDEPQDEEFESGIPYASSSRSSPGLLVTPNHEQTSGTSKVQSTSGTSQSATWISEETRSELNHDAQSSIHGMQSDQSYSRSAQDQHSSQLLTDDQDDLTSNTTEIPSLSETSRLTRPLDSDVSHSEDAESGIHDDQQSSEGDKFDIQSDCSSSTVVPSRQTAESTPRPIENPTGRDSGRYQSVSAHHTSNSPEASAVSEDDRFDSPRQHTAPTLPVLESSEADHIQDEEASSQGVDPDAHQNPSDHSSSPRNPSSSPTHPSLRNNNHLKRKVQHPSEWPDASELSRDQIEAYLDEHNVLYNRGARIARLVGSYNQLRSSLSQFGHTERPGKRRRTPRSSSLGSNAGDSLRTTRQPRRRNQRKTATSSDSDDAGFVYSRPESPYHLPVSPAPSSIPSASNYEPSVAPTIEPEPDPSVGDISEMSISTRSTRRKRRNSPTSANTSPKRLKKVDEPEPTTRRKRGRPRKNAAQKVQRRFRLQRASPPPPPVSNYQAGFHVNTNVGHSHTAENAPPQSSNPQDTVNNDIEATICRPVRRAPKKKRHRISESPSSSDHNQAPARPEPLRSGRTRTRRKSTHQVAEFPSSSGHNQACVPPEILQPRGSRPRRKSTQLGDRQEQSKQNSYTAYPSFHSNEQIPPAYDDHSSHMEGPQMFHPSGATSSPQQPQPVDHFSPTQAPPLPRSDDVTSGNPSRKRKHAEDLSPQAHSKRRVIQAHRFATPLCPAGTSRSSVRRIRQRQERVRGNSYTPRPSMHDGLLPLDPATVNRARNVEAWRSSLPPNLDLSSPPPPHGIHQKHHKPLERQCDCSSKDYLAAHLSRIADNVECIANRAICNPIQTRVISSRPSGARADLSLLARVRQHIRALLGKCMELNQFPPPATQQEKAQWQRELEDESDNESMSSDSYEAAFKTRDPAFPYLNGPGHRDLSAATLAIMWHSMRRAGVVSFRPDFSRGPRDVDNVFLWNLAHSIFITLVKAGEYEEIDLETTTEAEIRQAIFNHAKQLNRQYREAGWNPNRLDDRAFRKRRQERTRRLRDVRIKFLSGKPGLAALIPVVTECTSDAETDEEGNDSDVDVDGRHRDFKAVIVQTLPWRHPRLTRAFALIDKLIDLKRESGCKDYGRPVHKRIRPRESIKTSDRPCAKQLPADCYHSEWLRAQRVSYINSLKIQPGPELKPMIRRLEDLADSR